MVGEVVIHNEHVATLFHEILGDTGCRIRGNIGQARRIVPFGDHDDGVFHGALFAEGGHDFGHAGGALTDRTIYAQHILIPLVENSVERNGGLAGLPVPKDQLALAASNRNEGIDHLDAGLQRHRDRCAIHDRWCRSFNRKALAGDYRSVIVQRPSQWIDNSPDQSLADGHVHDMSPTLDFVTGL